MNINFEIPDEQIRDLAHDIMCNMPEYALNLRCVEWDYTNGKYVFEELGEDECEFDEDGKPKRYTVTVDDIAKKGLKIFIERELQGIYRFCGFNGLDELLDGGCYDADTVDAIVQLTIFGDMIYG